MCTLCMFQANDTSWLFEVFSTFIFRPEYSFPLYIRLLAAFGSDVAFVLTPATSYYHFNIFIDIFDKAGDKDTLVITLKGYCKTFS